MDVPISMTQTREMKNLYGREERLHIHVRKGTKTMVIVQQPAEEESGKWIKSHHVCQQVIAIYQKNI